jgi:anti-anti-sigma factor
MEFESSVHGTATVLLVKGRMDALTASEFEKECEALIQRGDRRLVADLSGLAYISSAGLRSILVVGKKLKALGGNVSFIGVSGMVGQVFAMSGFSSMFKIHDRLETALEGS